MNTSMPAEIALLRTRLYLERASGELERAATVEDDQREDVLAGYEAAVTKAREAWDEFTFVIGDQRRAHHEVAGFEVMRAAWLETAATVKSDISLQSALNRDNASRIEIVAGPMDLARRQYDVMVGQADALIDGVYGPSIVEERRQVLNDAARTAQTVTIVAATGLLFGLFVSRLSVRAARMQHQELESREAAQRADARRTHHETRVSRALEFARTEQAALDTVGAALSELFPGRETELLLADSSQAHFRRVLSTHTDAQRGCPVATPHDCPAVTKAQALHFDTSADFDVCPHLRDRKIEHRSAVCVPVSINGTASGVLHSLGPVNVRMDRESMDQLELLAARAGDRIGVLRAFSRSEAQAGTDPLTGLMNRRAFENEVGSMLSLGTRFTIAYGDLDQFKTINDRHGHPVGDRALRIFARVLRESLRSHDLPARWGGEEFVIAFPDTPLPVARAATERVQHSLRELVDAGLVPTLTVSFGLCDWTSGPDVDSLIHVADRLLLVAKERGRNRIVTPSDAEPIPGPALAQHEVGR